MRPVRALEQVNLGSIQSHVPAASSLSNRGSMMAT
jgi:hypothetical protein